MPADLPRRRRGPVCSARVVRGSVRANPAAYRLYASGPNGRLQDGAADDVPVALSTVRYDAAAHTAFLAPVVSPLPDGP